MSTPAAATAKLEAVSATVREPPKIKVKQFEWQSQGFAWREAFVRLQKDMTAQDLQDHPAVWSEIQADQNRALRRWDKVTCVSFDEAWAVNSAIVLDADHGKAVLGSFQIVRPPARESEWVSADGLFKVIWGGVGYEGFRVSDGVPLMIGYFSTIEAARSEVVRTQYPKTIG